MKNIGHNRPPISLDPKKTIKKNIKRRKLIVDEGIKFYKKLPLPSWIELSLIDVCNRSCVFCPKSDSSIAPDTYQKMSRALIDKLYLDLKKIKYNGSIALCGYGEPLLHKDIEYITMKLSKLCNVEIVTNGDVLTPKLLKKLFMAKAGRCLISMYDGIEQIDKLTLTTSDVYRWGHITVDMPYEDYEQMDWQGNDEWNATHYSREDWSFSDGTGNDYDFNFAKVFLFSR